MPVGELLLRTSSRELTEWSAYFDMEPFGEERADLRAGIVAATVANSVRDPKKSRAAKPQDFMPKFGKVQTGWEEQLAIVELLNAALGGKDIRQ